MVAQDENDERLHGLHLVLVNAQEHNVGHHDGQWHQEAAEQARVEGELRGAAHVPLRGRWRDSGSEDDPGERDCLYGGIRSVQSHFHRDFVPTKDAEVEEAADEAGREDLEEDLEEQAVRVDKVLLCSIEVQKWAQQEQARLLDLCNRDVHHCASDVRNDQKELN